MNNCPLPIHQAEFSNTLGYERRIKGIVYAQSVEDIQRMVIWANQWRVPLYTVSTGRNWGYGSSSPVINDCIILNLSCMNKINDFNAIQGTVVLEPGVTQGQLYNFLQGHNLDYLTPTTGAGPSASILGNALEKGYGITPYQDHMGSVMSIEGVLADGSIYRSALKEFGGHRSDDVFPWKIGPYLEGLFFQSNFAIVTRATIALSKKPESIRQFILFVEEQKFEDAVRSIAHVRQTYGSLVGGINLMNRRRVLSMMKVGGAWPKNRAINEGELSEITQDRRAAEWVVVGALYGPDKVLDVVQKELKVHFRNFSYKALFFNQDKLEFLGKIVNMAPLFNLKELVTKTRQAFDILSGIPSEIALPLAYLKNNLSIIPKENFQPDRDRCGLIWLAPLLPKDPELLRNFYQEIQCICLDHDIDPLVTFTSISERCFDSTIPILFDQHDACQKDQAYKCYNSLISMCKKFDVFPYRMDIMHMPDFFNRKDIAAVNLYNKIKCTLDPNGILSPGRYARNLD